MKKKYVVTDVDGVLLNRMPVYGEIFSNLLYKRFGINKDFSKKLYFSTAGTPIDEQFALVIKAAGFVVVSSIVSLLVKLFFEENSTREVIFFDGAQDIIKKFIMEGMALFATSGSQTEELKNIFFQNNLHYSVIMGSDIIKKSSKHIEIFAESVSVSLQEFASNAVYIGDGAGDMKIAKECGILAVGILTCPGVEEINLFEAGADVVIKDISQFPLYVL